MREVKDPEIKLFGKKIALPENGKIVSGEDSDVGKSVSASDVVTADESSIGSDRDPCLVDKEGNSSQQEESDDGSEYEKEETNKDQMTREISETNLEEKDQNLLMEESENLKSPSENKLNDSPTVKSSKTEDDQNDATNSQQKTLKKPDKILPCPRCNSMDTKFCYYNNYNVNQPRHFCKSCQRYWTAGGTMRNVPVGAGRRKNKNSASHCRHIMISEALEAARIDSPNGFHHPVFKPNGTVLSFGPDSPLCDSMACVLNLAEKKTPNGIRNGFYRPEHKNPSGIGGENGDDCSSGSSVTTSNSMAEGVKNRPPEAVMQTLNGFPSPVPCLPGVAWPFPFAAVPFPAISTAGYPMPFCPPPYWNCNVPGPWSLPWLTPPSPTANQKGSGSAPNSPLGKHSRDGELLKPNNPEGQKNSEGSVLVPKTLRIDDPDEAAKSSIWSTLGIKYDSVSRGGLFKALQPKSSEKDHPATTSPAFQANPAAFSRSLSFQERV